MTQNHPSKIALPEVDFYAVLNVHKKATPDEIRTAFRKLAVTYHPDRQSGQNASADTLNEATEKFTQIKNAYETLIDENKRSLYDEYGTEGLKSEWQIARRYKSTEEFKRDFAKWQRKKEVAFEEGKLPSRGETTFNISGSQLKQTLKGNLQSTVLQSMNIGQTTTIPLSDSDTALFTTNIGQNDKRVNLESFGVKWQRQFSSDYHGWLGAHRDASSMGVSIALWKKFSTKSSGYLESIFSLGGVNQQTMTFRHMITPRVAGEITCQYDTSQKSSVKLSVQRGTGRNVLAGETQLLLTSDSQLALTVGTSLKRSLSKRTHIESGISIDILDRTISIRAGGTRQVTKISTFDLYVLIQHNALILQFGYGRYGQKFNFPVYLTNAPSLKNILLAVAVPAFFSAIAKIFWIEPRKKIRRRRKIERIRRENAEVVAEAKRSAQSAIKLMLNSVARKRSGEESKRGLIIILALYGNLEERDRVTIESRIPPSENAGDSNEMETQPYSSRNNQGPPSPIIDVTIPIQYLVEDSQLHLHEGSKAHLLGFYDPCIGEDKQLYIRYLFHDKLHEITLDDTDMLGIPLASHRIDSA